MNLTFLQKRPLFFIFTVYAVCRLYIFFSLPLNNYVFNFDAIRYLHDAHCSLFSSCLYTDRPFFFPLFIKMLDYHYLALTISQLLLSITAWGFIAYCLSKQMQTKLAAYMVLSFILLYSCADYLILWDAKALSESLSISLLLFFIGSYILALQNGFSTISLISLILFSFLLVNVRDSNAYLVLVCGIATLIVSFLSNSIPKKAALILLTGCLISFVFNQWTADLGQRWLIPMGDLLVNRIINEASMLHYFLTAGMPPGIVAPIQAVQSVQGSYQGYSVLASHPLALNWFILHSRSVYMHYLLGHPSYILAIYLNHFFWQDILLASNLLQYVAYGIPLYLTKVDTAFLITFASPLSGWLNSISEDLMAIVLSIGLIAYFEQVKSAQRDKFIIFAQVLILLSIVVLAPLTWLAEPLENMRHQLSNHLLILIGIMLFSFKCLDHCVLKRRHET